MITGARRSALRRRIRSSRVGGLLGERGAVLVEFVIILPLLLLLLLGIIEMGWWIHVNNVVDQAARAGARRAAIDGAISPDAARSAAAVIDGSGLRATQATLEGKMGAGPLTEVSAATPNQMPLRCSVGTANSQVRNQPATVTFAVEYDYRPLFPALNSPLFFGGVGNLIGDVRTEVRLPSETEWLPGYGPISTFTGGQYRC